MRKKTSNRSIPLAEKVKVTVRRGSEEGRRRRARYLSPSPSEDDSSSWDRQSGATSASWSEEMEEATTRKVLEQWESIERTLYDEENQVTSSGAVLEECVQWRTQLAHLRVTGKNPIVGIVRKVDDSVSTVQQNEIVREDQQDSEEIFAQHSMPVKESDSFSKCQQREETQKEVINLILGFVCGELLLGAGNEDSLSKDLDMGLRITPAPACDDRNPPRRRRNNRKDEKCDNRNEFKVKVENARDLSETSKSVATIDNGEKSFVRGNALPISARKRRDTKNTTEDGFPIRRDRLYTPQLGRNKLGTVFNEKIVVSPVPFVLSTRESFSTLKTTPIRFTGQSLDAFASQSERSIDRCASNVRQKRDDTKITILFWSVGLARNVDLGLKTTSAGRIAPTRISHVHSAWQAPVCPTIWPKNVRLAPIDVSRLPSSKNRTFTESSSSPPPPPPPPRRSRNSLSPISRDSIPMSALFVTGNNNNNNDDESLAIKERCVFGESSNSNLLRAGWNSSPRIAKRVRKKGRGGGCSSSSSSSNNGR